MFSVDFFCLVLGKNKIGFGSLSINNFVIDSRDSVFGNCFIGLLGNIHDGGDFFLDVLKKGASGLILHQKYEKEYNKYIYDFPNSWAFFVDDTKKALQLLAKQWRSLFNVCIIAITGSVGKTTTKELIKDILEKNGHVVCATKESFNGSIGLPLTILTLRSEHTYAVFEIGVQKIGEMDVLIDILQSVSYSLITTILPSHIAYFKNINNIILEKIKLQNITKEIFFIDVLFQKYINYKNVITFGTSFDSNFFYKLDNLKIIIKDINCNKEYFIKALFHEGINHCIVVAFTLCYILKIKVENIINAVENFNNVVGRFSIHNLKKGGVIINDCYNAANHIVMLKSIEAFKLFETNKKKIIVLADMLEQGELNEIYHNIVVENVDNILDSCIEKVFYIGDSFSLSAKNSKKNTVIAKQFADVEDQVYEYLDLKYCILFKGSNGMKLFENINKYIKKEKDL